MAQIGSFIRTRNGFSGRLRTLSLDIELTIVPADHSDTENAPNYRVHAGDEEGPEVGAGWTRTGEKAGEYVALQAGLESESGPGYWGQALVSHHRSGRSRYWFGLVATIFLRSALLEHGLDHSFVSGEDIEIRMRLERARARAGVSRSVVVSHRFGDTFDFAMGQFLADGAGLARTARKHGWKATPLLGLPMAAGVRGAVLSLVRREPQWVPYYVTFAAVNSYAIARQLIREGRSHRR